MRQRLSHWLAVLKEPAWNYFFVLFFVLLPTLAWMRDEFAPPWLAEKLKLLQFFPHWQWYWWLIGALVVLIFLILEGAHRQFQKVETQSSAVSSASVADIAIADLFFHIDADTLENQTFEKIGQNILDHLAMGRIHAFGREVTIGVGIYAAFPNLAPIDIAYWKTARFTYQFFGDNRELDIHVETKPPAVGPSYRDLRFTNSEISLSWQKSKSSDQIFAAKATYQIITQSEWARVCAERAASSPSYEKMDRVERREAVRRQVLKEFHRDLHDHLRAGHIRTWARKDRHHPLGPIKSEEWDQIYISMTDYDLQNQNNGFCSRYGTGSTRETCYENVKFSKDDIFKTYPLLAKPYWKD